MVFRILFIILAVLSSPIIVVIAKIWAFLKRRANQQLDALKLELQTRVQHSISDSVASVQLRVDTVVAGVKERVDVAVAEVKTVAASAKEKLSNFDWGRLFWPTLTAACVATFFLLHRRYRRVRKLENFGASAESMYKYAFGLVLKMLALGGIFCGVAESVKLARDGLFVIQLWGDIRKDVISLWHFLSSFDLVFKKESREKKELTSLKADMRNLRCENDKLRRSLRQGSVAQAGSEDDEEDTTEPEDESDDEEDDEVSKEDKTLEEVSVVVDKVVETVGEEGKFWRFYNRLKGNTTVKAVILGVAMGVSLYAIYRGLRWMGYMEDDGKSLEVRLTPNRSQSSPDKNGVLHTSRPLLRWDGLPQGTWSFVPTLKSQAMIYTKWTLMDEYDDETDIHYTRSKVKTIRSQVLRDDGDAMPSCEREALEGPRKGHRVDKLKGIIRDDDDDWDRPVPASQHPDFDSPAKKKGPSGSGKTAVKRINYSAKFLGLTDHYGFFKSGDYIDYDANRNKVVIPSGSSLGDMGLKIAVFRAWGLTAPEDTGCSTVTSRNGNVLPIPKGVRSMPNKKERSEILEAIAAEEAFDETIGGLPTCDRVLQNLIKNNVAIDVTKWQDAMGSMVDKDNDFLVNLTGIGNFAATTYHQMPKVTGMQFPLWSPTQAQQVVTQVERFGDLDLIRCQKPKGMKSIAARCVKDTGERVIIYYARESNIFVSAGFMSRDGTYSVSTMDGTCGAVVRSLDDGMALAVHYAGNGADNRGRVNYGIPFTNEILNFFEVSKN